MSLNTSNDSNERDEITGKKVFNAFSLWSVSRSLLNARVALNSAAGKLDPDTLRTASCDPHYYSK